MSQHPATTLLIPPAPPNTQLEILWQAEMPVPPTSAAAHIAERWAIYMKQAQGAGKSLFDGPITQLMGVTHTMAADGLRVTLHLAPGSYKDFVVTCLRDRAWFEAHAGGFRVAALGNSALVTHGDRALLGRRSPKVNCYAGRLHMIGGVLEGLGTETFPASRTGLEAHLLLELQEEIGLAAGEECREKASRFDIRQEVPHHGAVQETSPGWPRVLGLAQEHVLNQPELFWQWEVNVALEELLMRMNPEEHSGGVIVGRGRMEPALWEQLTPVARLALEWWEGA